MTNQEKYVNALRKITGNTNPEMHNGDLYVDAFAAIAEGEGGGGAGAFIVPLIIAESESDTLYRSEISAEVIAEKFMANIPVYFSLEYDGDLVLVPVSSVSSVYPVEDGIPEIYGNLLYSSWYNSMARDNVIHSIGIAPYEDDTTHMIYELSDVEIHSHSGDFSFYISVDELTSQTVTDKFTSGALQDISMHFEETTLMIRLDDEEEDTYILNPTREYWTHNTYNVTYSAVVYDDTWTDKCKVISVQLDISNSGSDTPTATAQMYVNNL